MGTPPVYEGKTLEDAVRKGLEALGLSRAEAMITVIEEGSGGFLGFGSRPYRVRIMARPGGAIREAEERRPREGRERDRDRDRGRRGGRGRDRDRGGRSEGRGREERSDRPPVAAGDERRDRPPMAAGDERRGRDDRGRGREERGGRARPPLAMSGERRDRDDRRRSERGAAPRTDERRLGERRDERPSEPRGEGRPMGRPELVPSERQREPTDEPVASMSDIGGDRGGADEDGGRRRRRRGRRGGRGRGGREMGPRIAPASEPGTEPSMAPEPFDDVTAGFEDPVMSGAPHSHAADAPAPFAQPRPMAAAPPRREAASAEPPISNDALAAEGKRWTEDLLRAMGFEARVTAVAEQDRVDVTAEVSQDDELLTGPKGEVRQALQHLLNRMVNAGEGTRYHLQLEINDFWKRREDELRDLAGRLAEEAVTTGGEVVTEYLNAQERRIVHVTLREDTRVKTYALGDGMIKRLAVAPADYPEGPRGED